jgi:hypothetical protein
MHSFPQDPSPESGASALIRWVAGVRYPGGTEIWCAERAGEAAWTTDRRLAATFPSESNAVMAARLLADGGTVAFWARVEG